MEQPEVKLVRFPSIETPEKVFSHLMSASRFVRFDKRNKTSIYDQTLPLPIITLRGTVKLHGANCSVVQTRISKDQKVTHFQSRNKILGLEPGKDYMGFTAHMSKHLSMVDEMFKYIFITRSHQKIGKTVTPDDVASITIFGEWCGGSIQKDIAISQFETMFIIFAVKIVYHPSLLRRKPDEQVEWMDISLIRDMHSEEARIFNILQFKTYQVIVNLAKEQSMEDGLRLMEALTLEVQEECPVAKNFGAKNVLTNGEGIVWQVIQVTPRPNAGPNPNLKLERFMTPGCWMKTRDVKAASSSAEQRKEKKRSMTKSTSWRREDKKTLESPDLAFKWEDEKVPSPETSKSTLPALNVAVTWPSGKCPSVESAATGSSWPDPSSIFTASTAVSGHTALDTASTQPLPNTSLSIASPTNKALSTAFLSSRHFATSTICSESPVIDPLVDKPASADLTSSDFTSLKSPLMGTLPASPISAQLAFTTFTSLGSPAIDSLSAYHTLTSPSYSYGTHNRSPATDPRFDKLAPVLAQPTTTHLLDSSFMEQLNQLAVKPAVVNQRSDTIFNIYGSIESLVNFVTPDTRLKQGLHEMDNEWHYPRHVRAVGPFIEWVVKDVFKEQSHRIDPSGFDREEVFAAISARATRWYLNNLPKEWWASSEGMTDRV